MDPQSILGKRSSADNTSDVSDAQTFLDNMSEHMKDSHSRTCYKDRCNISRLGYGFPGDDKISCKHHYTEVEGMQKQENKCVYRGCNTKGVNRVGGTRYRFCASHRDELIRQGLPAKSFNDITNNRKCAEEGCDVAASYDNRTRCKQHSLTGKSKERRRCDFPGCQSEKRPTFGFDGMTKTRCREHKEEGMVSRKMCEEEHCTKSASFGLRGGVATHCKQHAPNDALIVNAKTCGHEECNKQPIFGERGSIIATHCKNHAPHNFVDVKNKRCGEDGCENLTVNSTAFCVSHGGGRTCSMACCADGGPHAQYRSPDDSTWICAFGARYLMETAYMDNDNNRVRLLMEHFGRKSIMVLNQQSAFRTEIEKMYWRKLQSCCDVFFDESVSDKPKSLNDYRPDIFYKWRIDGVCYGVHIEYDEGYGHEDDDTRLKWIADASDAAGRVYVIRVRDRNSGGRLCDRCQLGSVVYFKVNAEGKRVAKEVAGAVMERIDWIAAGLAPDDGAGRPGKLYM